MKTSVVCLMQLLVVSLWQHPVEGNEVRVSFQESQTLGSLSNLSGALADLDNDGDFDIYLSNYVGPSWRGVCGPMSRENVINEYLETGLRRTVALSIAKLTTSAFGESGPTIDQRVTRMLSAAGSDDPEKTSGRRFVIWDGARAIAHARTFVRIVNAEHGQLPVLALASVCTDPEIRGRGLGADITRHAFTQIGQSGWPDVSLFQTPVQRFYEKLNCRVVTNRFVNRRNAADPEADPWRDGTIMIYPADANWPPGTIDLNGPDY